MCHPELNEIVSDRVAAFDAMLQKMCLISVGDAGLDTDDVMRFADDATSEEEIKQAVLEYADHYGLDVVGRGWL